MDINEQLTVTGRHSEVLVGIGAKLPTCDGVGRVGGPFHLQTIQAD